MKRSDAIKLLQESFFKYMNDATTESDDEMYSKILEDLETAGMRPPKLQAPIEAEEPSHPQYHGRYEWEPEVNITKHWRPN